MKISLFILCQVTVFHICLSQITLSPDIGVSYLPFELYGFNKQVSSKNIDLIIGVLGEVPLRDKWSITFGVHYIIRKPVRIKNQLFSSDYQYTELHHSDLTINLLGSHEIFEKLNLNFGASIIYKLNAYFENIYQVRENDRTYFSQFIFGVLLGKSFKLKHFSLNFSYIRLFKEEQINRLSINRKEGKNRFDLTVAFPIFMKK